MKNLLSLILLVACCSFLASTTASAQDLVINYTNCDFKVKVSYGPTGSCTSTGTIVANVPANTSINLGLPAGTQIIAAKGAYDNGGGSLACPFYVGQAACTSYPQLTTVSCSTNCGDYIVSFDETIVFKIAEL